MLHANISQIGPGVLETNSFELFLLYLGMTAILDYDLFLQIFV